MYAPPPVPSYISKNLDPYKTYPRPEDWSGYDDGYGTDSSVKPYSSPYTTTDSTVSISYKPQNRFTGKMPLSQFSPDERETLLTMHVCQCGHSLGSHIYTIYDGADTPRHKGDSFYSCVEEVTCQHCNCIGVPRSILDHSSYGQQKREREDREEKERIAKERPFKEREAELINLIKRLRTGNCDPEAPCDKIEDGEAGDFVCVYHESGN